MLKTLQDISEFANNGKLYKIENEMRIVYVHETDKNSIIQTIINNGSHADLVEISL